MSSIELRDRLPLDDPADVAASAPSEPGDGWNWGLIVAFPACLTFWAGVTAGIWLVFA